MLTVRTDEGCGLIEIEVDGRIDLADFDAAVTAIDRLLEHHHQLLAVEIIRSFGGADPAVWWRDLTWGVTHIHKFARAAVVTDSQWMGPIARVVAAIVPSEVRTFPLAEVEAARRWVRTRCA